MERSGGGKDGSAGCAAFIVVLVAIGLGSFALSSCRKHKLANVASLVDSRIRQVMINAVSEKNQNAYIKRKAMVLDRGGNPNQLHLKLPGRLRASSREEIGTIIVVEETKDVVGLAVGFLELSVKTS